MSIPAGSMWRKFVDLLPKSPRYIGDVVSIEPGERYAVQLVGGGLLLCSSQTPYAVGARVFVSDKRIEGSAPVLDSGVIEV